MNVGSTPLKGNLLSVIMGFFIFRRSSSPPLGSCCSSDRYSLPIHHRFHRTSREPRRSCPAPDKGFGICLFPSSKPPFSFSPTGCKPQSSSTAMAFNSPAYCSMAGKRFPCLASSSKWKGIDWFVPIASVPRIFEKPLHPSNQGHP